MDVGDRLKAAVEVPLIRRAGSGREAPFVRPRNGHSMLRGVFAAIAERHDNEISLLIRWHDHPFKLGFRATRDCHCRRCKCVPGELTPVFAPPGPVTTLLRDTQAYEFAKVFCFPVDADRRSDIFTSQTVNDMNAPHHRSIIYRVREPGLWVTQMKQRRPLNVVIVAMANKLARIIWAMLAHQRPYRKDYEIVKPA